MGKNEHENVSLEKVQNSSCSWNKNINPVPFKKTWPCKMVGLEDLSFLSSVLEKKRLVQPTLTPRLLCSKPSTLHCNRDNWRNIVITSEFRVTFGMYCKFRFRKRFCRVDRCQQNPADILVSVKRKLFWLQAAMKIMRSWRIYCNLMDFWKKKRHPPCQSDSATNSCSKAGFFPCGSGFFHIARVFFSETMAVVSAWNP